MSTNPDPTRRRPRVAIVSLARSKGMGAGRRAASLHEVFELAGADVFDIGLMADHRRSGLSWLGLPVWKAVNAEIVPEALAWDAVSVSAELTSLDIDIVILETIRAFHPRLLEGSWSVVLDYVDQLSLSYRDRSTIVRQPAQRLLFRLLARTADRFERRVSSIDVPTITNGYDEARELASVWVPITQELLDPPAGTAGADVVFFGNLSYPPNVAAVERLAKIWPLVSGMRPGSTMLLAGARMMDEQRTVANRLGWQLAPDFEDLEELLSGVKVAVVPLDHASGLQIKVLEGAAAGLAQVLSPAAKAGLDDDFPGMMASSDEEFAAHIVDLLSDDARRDAIGDAARRHIASRYAPEYWSVWAREFMHSLTGSPAIEHNET